MFYVKKEVNLSSLVGSRDISLLLNLPKYCGCNACNSVKSEFRTNLGEALFKKVCKTIGLAH